MTRRKGSEGVSTWGLSGLRTGVDAVIWYVRYGEGEAEGLMTFPVGVEG